MDICSNHFLKNFCIIENAKNPIPIPIPKFVLIIFGKHNVH